MRKSINKLSVLVEGALELDPFSGYFFAFSNRRRTIVKILYWNRSGFCLWQRRLEKDRFKWPETTSKSFEIGMRELNWLLDGLEINQGNAHGRLKYRTVL
ncbi:MAG: IS66 family insertion sequence element accessory protein TnpB [Candidatus Magnetominusculus sp. LBB02]|nr:IS66 family insertion sequence element accessory protein TnpB [Candidatus Magnetominusculus sp. LBB02]MCG6552507.1 IS66 family insertion sequence element accessory protein TnpB [Candidatus Magnetominusculus sp. LBB02]